jgi:uncharacterized protein YbaR (Trm112 family)
MSSQLPSQTLIDLLRCPLSGQSVRLASIEERAGLPAGLEGALVREDGKMAYPIRDGIPVLLAEEILPVKSAST